MQSVEFFKIIFLFTNHRIIANLIQSGPVYTQTHLHHTHLDFINTMPEFRPIRHWNKESSTFITHIIFPFFYIFLSRFSAVTLFFFFSFLFSTFYFLFLFFNWCVFISLSLCWSMFFFFIQIKQMKGKEKPTNKQKKRTNILI